MKENYFKRVAKLSPTLFWINNPTREQADRAIAEGAVGCTSNPSYTQKMIDHPAEGSYALSLLDETLRQTGDDGTAAILFQQKMVKPIAERFYPIYLSSGKQQGYVSIQGDPIHDEDPHELVEESLENRKVGANIACKVPTTAAGLAAMEELIACDTPINATEIFGLSQMVTMCEAYQKASKKTGKKPAFFMSHIAGIYDDYLKKYVEENKIDISPDVLWQGGLAVARKVYEVMVERNYPCVFVSGGSRGLQHFTELIGGKMCITINWEGTADKLLEQDPPVVYRIFNPVPQKVIDELMEKLPDFRRGYLEDGLAVDEFNDFGPVQLFRSSFVKSWEKVLGTIKKRREQISA